MRRLNVKLALWLVGITLFLCVGVHFLHGYQVDKNATVLKVLAERAKTQGNYQEAIKQYNQFLRHRDDRDGYKALADLVVKVAKEAEATKQDKIRAYNILEEAIRRHPDLDEVRLSLVDYTMMMRRFQDAQDHIRILKENGNTDPELDLKSAQCVYLNGDQLDARKQLCKLIGYDEQTGMFAEQMPPGAKALNAFVFLGQIYRAQQNNLEMEARADNVMKQLVAWNPDSALAHQYYGSYLLRVWANTRPPVGDNPQIKKEAEAKKAELLVAAKAELDKSLELKADDADSLLMRVTLAMAEQDLKTAEVLVDKARALHPKRQDVYLRSAELAQLQNDRPKALELLKDGLTKSTDKRGLLEQLIELQLASNDLKAARATSEEMAKLQQFPPEYLAYQKGRLSFGEGKFAESAQDLERIRPAIERLSPVYLRTLETILGKCYEFMGQPDRQLEVYRRMLDASPDMIIARLGQATALQSLGRHDEAQLSVDLLANNAHLLPSVAPTILQLVMTQEAAKPEEKRNWEMANKIAAQLKADKNRTPADNELLTAEMLIAQGKRDEAMAILGKLRKEEPKNVTVWMAYAKLMNRDQKTRDKIGALLDMAEKAVGDDVLQLRVERVRSIGRNGAENGVEELKKEEADLGSLPEAQQTMMRYQIGTAYLLLDDYENAKRCWREVSLKDPTNAQLRQYLFELALDKKDKAGAAEILKELEGSKHFGSRSALYKYCVAAQKLQAVTAMKKDKPGPVTAQEKEELADIRKTVDEAIAVRQEWAPLYRVRGEIAQLEGNLDVAIADYQKSIDFNRTGQAPTANRLVQLLHHQGKYSEAYEVIQKYLGGNVDPALRAVQQDIEARMGNSEKAMQLVEEDITKNPTAYEPYLRKAQLLEAAGKTDEAEASYRKATEVAPKAFTTWEYLVKRLVGSKKLDEARAAVAEAGKSIQEPLILGRLSQRVNDPASAEKYYAAAIEAHPDNLAALRHIIEFYMGTNQSAKAMPYLDQLIEKGAKTGEPIGAGQVAWARRRKAERIAQGGKYSDIQEAIREVEKNAVNGKLGPDDTLGVIQLLAARPEPESRARAIKMIEELRRTRALTARELSTLGQLYNREGKWDQSRDLMQAAVNSGSDDPEILLVYAAMLLEHKEMEDAQRFTNQLDELIDRAPTPVSESIKQSARMLRAKLLINEGKKDEAAKLVEVLIIRPLPQAQLFRLELVARQMESLELYDDAERLLNEYVELEPRAVLAMAAFKARRGDTDKAFALLDESRKSSQIERIMPVGLEMLRSYPDKSSDERFKLLEKWATDALAESKEKRRIQLLLAELYDTQGRYADVEKVYREILADETMQPADRAVVKNNLSFVLSVFNPSAERASESMKLIDEAIQVLGPRSDLLDTRALAYLAGGNAKQAAADLRTAVVDSPSMSKYYHLAMAEKKLGNLDAAREAIAKAEELRVERNSFTPLERKAYDQLVSELK